MTSRSARRRLGGPALWLTALFVAAGLSGCSPIEGYRSMVGFDKNDPDPATAPFGENLASAENKPYPNLASVPPPPIVSTTTAERAKIAAGLNEQRASTQAPDVRGLPGSPAPGPVPPPPPIPPSLAASEVASVPTPPPQPAPPPRAANEPPQAQPLTSTLQPPGLSGPPPGVAASRPAPAQAAMQPMPKAAPSELPPTAVQSGNPLPSPPPPVLPVPKPSPQAAALPPPKLPPVPVVVAALDVAPGAAALSEAERARLADVVAQYKQREGVVRVVAYAAPAVGGAEQLNSFRTALDRAQVVAKALNDAGIPAKQIQTEASPSTAAAPTGRVEVQLLPAAAAPNSPGGHA